MSGRVANGIGVERITYSTMVNRINQNSHYGTSSQRPFLMGNKNGHVHQMASSTDHCMFTLVLVHLRNELHRIIEMVIEGHMRYIESY